MKKTLVTLGLALVIVALIAISWPGSPVQLVSVKPIATPAQNPPTTAPVAPATASATQTPRPTETLTPLPTVTLVLTDAPNPYLEVLAPLADSGKTWVQLDGQITGGTPVLLVDLRKKDEVYVSVSVHFNPAMQDFLDRDLGPNWNGADKGQNKYERIAFAYSDDTLPTNLKVAVCKMAYNFYVGNLPITGAEVEMSLDANVGVKPDDRGFVKLLDVFVNDPNFDCDGHSWGFLQTPTPIPTETKTP